MLKRGMTPSHPGTLLGGMIDGLREETGQPYTIGEVAEGLGITRKTLSAILNKRSGITPDMAVKLSEAFGTSADIWLNLQKKFDLWHAEKRVSRTSIRHFLPAIDGVFVQP